MSKRMMSEEEKKRKVEEDNKIFHSAPAMLAK
jgi:hypothetical protein